MQKAVRLLSALQTTPEVWPNKVVANDGEQKKIGFIGAGRLAEALARGFIGNGVIKPENIFASDTVPERRAVFESFGARSIESNQSAVDRSDVIFVSVKPQYVDPVLREIRSSLRSDHLVVSIAAGITLQTLKVTMYSFRPLTFDVGAGKNQAVSLFGWISLRECIVCVCVCVDSD